MRSACDSGNMGSDIVPVSSKRIDALSLRCILWVALGALVFAPPIAASAQDAEVVSLVGKGDSRETADAEWKPATIKQKLQAGWFVRTREMSQMALLLKDNTQVRLNQLSILNIKSIGAAAQTTRLDLQQGRGWSQSQTSLDLQRGRIWAQFKSVLYGVTIALGAPPVTVTTKTATIGIRGTDWEVTVGDDDKTTVTLLSGEADVSNDFGRVSLGPNEQATAEVGKAPVKRYLTDASDRVQWVTAYRPQPRRWVKDARGGLEAIVRNIEAQNYPPAVDALSKDKNLPRLPADLLLADLNLFLGEPGKAIALLTPHANDGRGDPAASALLARTLIIAGRITDAERVLKNTAQKQGNHVEVLLSQAELSRLQGDTEGTRRACAKVLEIDPKNAEAWYVIGRIETEREYVKAARDALNQAITLRPDGPGYRGELATLETFSNEFAAADAAFREALAQHPDDYVALTGLGVLQLKRGETQAALESFLKAGVIEPRYARAWLFSGVAYYQLEDRGRALEAFRKASALDGKDPLPHLISSLVHYDALELGRAIEAAREAQARMPYLKSLNQVLTDQKGNANVGSALAAFGMEEWSQAYAYDSYSPYWAGSHLFLADRFSGTFNKNSELFKGFLSDPNVFGASNRFSSLVPVPGHYGSIEAKVNRDYFTEAGLNATLNGYSVATKPFSYFLSFDKTDGDSAINRTDADGRLRARGDNLTLGLGVKPTHELGIFAFANKTSYDGHFADRASGLVNDSFKLDSHRVDVGLNYKFSPTNHAWLKAGDGSEKTPLNGAFLSPRVADTLNASPLGAVLTFTPAGRLNAFQPDQSQHDVQWRQTFDMTPAWQLSWGAEYAKESKPFFLDFEFPTTSLVFPSLRTRLSQDNRVESGNVYLSNRFALSNSADAQLDLFYQDTKTSFATRQTQVLGAILIPSPAVTGEDTDRELNPRVGFKWHPAPSHTLRLAAQVWRKPPGVNTLAPVDTVGIPVDDQLETAGGRLKRARLQHEMQLGGATFAQWFLDHKDVQNPSGGGAGIVKDLQLIDLERLRSRKRVYAVRQEFLEDTPDFGAGRVDQFGVSVNRLLSRAVTAAVRYVYSDSKNTTPAFRDRAVPFHPRHYANLALNWQPYARWIIGPTATYRSSRYRDEANLEPLSNGWVFGLQAYWESEDKRWSVAGAIDQVHSDKQSSIYRHPVVLVQGAYRF
jgi:Flp pilus assembly protein TadD